VIKLYQLATSPFTEKVRRALNYKQLLFEVHEVDRAAAGAGKYAHVSASGKFPVLEHDGAVVQDSTDILEYLDRAFPDRPLRPEDPRERALVHMIEDWADESLYFYEMTMRLAWPHNLEAALDEFAQSMPGVPREVVKDRILEGVGALTKAQGLGRKSREQVVADVERHFRAIDDLLAGREWLVGSGLSSADLAVASQVHALLYAEEAREALDRTHHVRPWMARIDTAAPKLMQEV
jgi:glutathione S-transferase